MIDLLVDRWGVRHIFGLPGDGINGLIEALRKRRRDVQFIQVRHEEAAAFAAVGYAKFSGRLGVCLATSGPGAIHLLNGLFDAKLDGVPVLAITGMQFHDLIGTFYQQDVDTVRLMDSVAVYSERVMGPAHVENVTNLAVRMALSNRGVAHLGFPNDFQEKPAAEAKYSMMDVPDHTSADWRVPVVRPTDVDLERAAEVLNKGTAKSQLLLGQERRERGRKSNSSPKLWLLRWRKRISEKKFYRTQARTPPAEWAFSVPRRPRTFSKTATLC